MKKVFLMVNMAGLLALRIVAAAAVISLTAVGPAHADTEEAATWRQRVAISVALAPGQPATYVVRGELCATDDELLPGTTVQLLIDGVTYNRDYRDRIDGTGYSYARDVAARGFPTFALNLLGSRDSSNPLSDQLTIQAAAYVAHQIVRGLRNGAITGVQFGKVIMVGHSLGSVVVWQEAISYGDVDGLIVTGAAQSPSTRFQGLAKTDFYPAVDDPTFAGGRLDTGYLTAVPSTRATIQAPVLTVLDGLQVSAAVAWSSAFVGQYRFGERRDLDDLDHSQNSLWWNDGLPWNCDTGSTESE